MNKEYFNQSIHCTVEHCKYYDDEQEKCTLGSITVGEKHHKGTLCENYEKNELE